MTNNLKHLSLFFLTTLLLIDAPATQAAFSYEYSIDFPRGKAYGGDIKNITTQFNTTTEVFSWSYSAAQKQGQFNDGFWLVVSDGPPPVQDNGGGMLTILYGDLTNNKLTAYEYDGTADQTSYLTPGNLLDSWDNIFDISVENDLQTVSFTIDASRVNSALESPDWEGIQFNELIGIWFHPSLDTVFTYDPTTDQLINFEHGAFSSHDRKNRLVTTPAVVPLPATLWLFSAALAGLFQLKRRA